MDAPLEGPRWEYAWYSAEEQAYGHIVSHISTLPPAHAAPRQVAAAAGNGAAGSERGTWNPPHMLPRLAV